MTLFPQRIRGTRAGSRQAAAAMAIALACLPARAVMLGEMELRSFIGDPFDARIPLSLSAGESVEPNCIRASPSRGAVSGFASARIGVEAEAGRMFVRVRTIQPIEEPAGWLRVEINCPGISALSREFAFLLDPKDRPDFRPQALPQADTPARAASVVAPRPGGLTILTDGSQSIADIARRLEPGNRRARNALIERLRDANPDALRFARDEPLPLGLTVVVPAAEAAPRSEPREPVARAPRAPRPTASGREAAPPRREARPSRPAVSAPLGPAAVARAEGEFRLRLSAGALDARRIDATDEATRKLLRERQLLLDADDQTAAILQLRDSVKKMEGRVAELQLKLDRLTGTPGQAAGSVSPAPPPGTAQPAASAPAGVATAPPTTTAPAPVTTPPTAPTKPSDAAPAVTKEATKAPVTPTSEPAPIASVLPSWLWLALLAIPMLFAVWWWLRRRRTLEDRATTDFLPDIPEANILAPSGVPGRLSTLEGAMARQGRDAELARDLKVTATEPFDPSRTVELTAFNPEMAKAFSGKRAAEEAENPELARRRYIEARFPEFADGLALADPQAVVKAARLYYQGDKNRDRAIELLNLARDENPKEPRPWLALFEIYRLESMRDQYVVLAESYLAQFGPDDHWPRICQIGRSLHPDALIFSYVGRTEEGEAEPALRDENWLELPIDFAPEALASELREALLELDERRRRGGAPTALSGLTLALDE